eukprot:CAMPEP_0204522648 /NCGR_PEP_ID=MMETSP0661-20131031/6433_1 /ASSEMBLY_ACC=CAM_ASM_000606 /TAXON_ID=109239 /ORGANISM="Alexandrium margalefi, Strain AMGDE01CS-322" /LENGTH=228 /DNA_ID=CAMNT_0051528329 /DNA_START=113 /DNA_END=799 /DNA_ORIENTATION=+
MGCSTGKFTEDEAQFFTKAFQPTAPLNRDLVSESSVLRVVLKKAMSDDREDCMVRTADGADLVKCVAAPGRKKIYTPKSDLICVLVFSVHYSEVNAVDATFHLPHVYLYALRPLKEGQEASEYKEGDQPLYMWARIHKVSNIASRFEVALAEFKGSPKGHNLEKFGVSRFASTLYKDGRMEVVKERDGCCRVEPAADGSEAYTVSIARCIDPVLMLCTIMSMESLSAR